MVIQQLSNFVGKSGNLGDEEFNSLVGSLEFYASIVDEEEEAGTFADFISTTYKEIASGEHFELWYQVRTPDSPEGMEFAYGFDKL